LGLIKSQESVENTDAPTLIDTPSKLNLVQINECYAEADNTCNDNYDQLVAVTSTQLQANPNDVKEEAISDTLSDQNTSKNNKVPTTNGDREMCPDEHNRNLEGKFKEKEKEEGVKLEAKNSEKKTNSEVLSAKGLYSTSSTHLCSKLSETLQNTDYTLSQTAVHQSVKSLDLSNHDIRTSVRYLKSFSGSYFIPLYLSYGKFAWPTIGTNLKLSTTT
jgi:hypothetical protein